MSGNECKVPRKLFLLGSHQALEVAARPFVRAAGARRARIAVLTQDTDGFDDHRDDYLPLLDLMGEHGIQVIRPDARGQLSTDDACDVLSEATGIFVCGGHIPTYLELYGGDPIRRLITERHLDGIPFAGMSAGTLIAQDAIALPAKEYNLPCDDANGFVRLSGLGLISGVTVEVHFTEKQRLPRLLKRMKAIPGHETGFGIDEGACAVFSEGRFERALGEHVHKATISDAARHSYLVERIVP